MINQYQTLYIYTTMFKKEYENIWSKVVDHIAINMHNLLMVFIILTQPVNRWNILKLQNSNLSFFILNFSLFKHFLFWATYVSYNNTCVCLSVFLSVYICTFRIHSFFSLSSSLEPDVMCGYRLYFTNVTWHTAYKICEAEKKMLVQLDSDLHTFEVIFSHLITKLFDRATTLINGYVLLIDHLNNLCDLLRSFFVRCRALTSKLSFFTKLPWLSKPIWYTAFIVHEAPYLNCEILDHWISNAYIII